MITVYCPKCEHSKDYSEAHYNLMYGPEVNPACEKCGEPIYPKYIFQNEEIFESLLPDISSEFDIDPDPTDEWDSDLSDEEVAKMNEIETRHEERS